LESALGDVLGGVVNSLLSEELEELLSDLLVLALGLDTASYIAKVNGLMSGIVVEVY